MDNFIFLCAIYEKSIKSIELNNLKGNIEFINDILIVNDNNVINYYEKYNDTYNIINIPDYFDCKFYINNYEDLKKAYNNDYNKIRKHWVLFGRINNTPYYEKYKIILNDEIIDFIFNYTSEYIVNINNKKKYKIKKNNDDCITINISPYNIENYEIIYEEKFRYKIFIKNIYNIYEEQI